MYRRTPLHCYSPLAVTIMYHRSNLVPPAGTIITMKTVVGAVGNTTPPKQVCK